VFQTIATFQDQGNRTRGRVIMSASLFKFVEGDVHNVIGTMRGLFCSYPDNARARLKRQIDKNVPALIWSIITETGRENSGNGFGRFGS
jgi:hypothetical protein